MIFFEFNNSIWRLTEASEIKKITEKDNNHIDTEISVIKPPPTILKVYNVASIKRSIITNFLNINVYKFEIKK